MSPELNIHRIMNEHRSSEAKVREALDLLREAAEDEGSDLRTLIRSRYEELKEALDRSRSKASARVGRLVEMKDRGREKVRRLAGRATERVRDEPWRAVAAAVTCGLVAGFLLDRRM
jgi:ElaB/YqjD/DUF883 family membrane-anchored ribosome-binding protein